MPLLLICGNPCSGKTTRAREFISHVLSLNPHQSVKLINYEEFSIDRDQAHLNSQKEKELRSFFRSNIDKFLDSQTLVISDYLNYIKGYRYELFYIARTLKQNYCVLYCDTPQEKAREFNNKAERGYAPELFDDLWKRMEEPNSKNRWDRPLFTVWPEEKLPCQEIHDVLFSKNKKLKTLVSTQKEKSVNANYVQDINTALQEMVDTIVEQMNKNRLF